MLAVELDAVFVRTVVGRGYWNKRHQQYQIEYTLYTHPIHIDTMSNMHAPAQWSIDRALNCASPERTRIRTRLSAPPVRLKIRTINWPHGHTHTQRSRGDSAPQILLLWPLCCAAFDTIVRLVYAHRHMCAGFLFLPMLCVCDEAQSIRTDREASVVRAPYPPEQSYLDNQYYAIVNHLVINRWAWQCVCVRECVWLYSFRAVNYVCTVCVYVYYEVGPTISHIQRAYSAC